MMTDNDLIYECENETHTRLDVIVARENLDQKRMLGHMIYRRDYEDPTFVFDRPADVAKAKNPGEALVLDNWQVRDYAEKNRLQNTAGERHE